MKECSIKFHSKTHLDRILHQKPHYKSIGQILLEQAFCYVSCTMEKNRIWMHLDHCTSHFNFVMATTTWIYVFHFSYKPDCIFLSKLTYLVSARQYRNVQVSEKWVNATESQKEEKHICFILSSFLQLVAG